MYPIFLQMIQSDKTGIQHPLTLNMKPFQISKCTWNLFLKAIPTNHFLGTPPCLKKPSTPISLPKKKKATKLFRWVQPHRWWQSMEVNFPSSLNREKDPPSAPRFSGGVVHGFRHFSFGRFLLGGGFSRIYVGFGWNPPFF